MNMEDGLIQKICMRFNNFRITNIYNIVTGNMPIKEGLAIEKKCSDGDSYYVIGFVKWVKNDVEYEDCGFRIFDLDLNEFKKYKELVEIAIKLVRTANDESEY